MANQTGSDQDGRLEQTAASALCANQAGGWSAKPQITRISNVDEVESLVVLVLWSLQVVDLVLYSMYSVEVVCGAWTEDRVVRRACLCTIRSDCWDRGECGSTIRRWIPTELQLSGIVEHVEPVRTVLFETQMGW